MLSFISCQKEIKNAPATPNNVVIAENQRLASFITKQTQATWLSGQVLDELTRPVSGATVTCGGHSTTTDSKGFFNFVSLLTVNKDYALIKVTKQGFVEGFRTFTPSRDKISYHTEKIILQTAGATVVVPSTGGSITIDNIKLTFPVNSVVKENGSSYSGNISIHARYIDPSASLFPFMIPGMLAGLNDAGTINALQSLGMANVKLSDASGNPLEIAPGQTVKMELPAPANSPSSIPLWHFNEAYGIWIQQGNAIKQGNIYIAEVSHFSIWNLDFEFNSYELKVKFQMTDGTPIPGMNVVANVMGGFTYPAQIFTTDNNGEAILINCPSNRNMLFMNMFGCDTISYAVAPVTQNRTETITINNSNARFYRLSGTLLTCGNQPVLNKPFQVFMSNANSYVFLTGISDAQGKFVIGTVSPLCLAPNFNAVTSSYINSKYYFSTTTTITPGLNIYNPILCDSSGNGGQPFNDTDIVFIPDPVMQFSVRLRINKPTGNIIYADVKNITSLDLGFQPVQSIIGIQYFTSLDSFGLWKTQVTDITPLQNNTNISLLDLRETGLSNINPLQNLTNLKTLLLNQNNITDIRALNNKPLLRNLYLSRNRVQDLAPLQNITTLTRLYLDSNQVTSVASLQNLANLTELDISRNQINDIAGLRNLSSLRWLWAQYNQVITIQFLINNLPNLTLFGIITGNTVPVSERDAFRATHPSCNLF